VKGAEGFIARLNPDLTVDRQEVHPSPMLDLVEVRTENHREAEGGISTTFYDRGEASKLSVALEEAVVELEAAGPAIAGEEANTKEPPAVVAVDAAPPPAARYIAVREVGGGWRVIDRETWHVLAAIFAGDPEGLEDAERWARQLNSSADMAAAEKAARAQAGEARAA
jgi:hypothetical protein